uniref:Uncharacterized protein n=1 Tax=Rhipicephalus zambeziensis TaxID=60191 RepID=A0A224Y583_9ACAR
MTVACECERVCSKNTDAGWGWCCATHRVSRHPLQSHRGTERRAVTAALSLCFFFYFLVHPVVLYCHSIVCQALSSLLSSITCVMLCLPSFSCPLLARQ